MWNYEIFHITIKQPIPEHILFIFYGCHLDNSKNLNFIWVNNLTFSRSKNTFVFPRWSTDMVILLNSELYNYAEFVEILLEQRYNCNRRTSKEEIERPLFTGYE